MIINTKNKNSQELLYLFRITANKTEKITLGYRAHVCNFVPTSLSVFPHEKWRKMIAYFLDACPNLKVLDIRICYEEIDASSESMLLHFDKAG